MTPVYRPALILVLLTAGSTFAAESGAPNPARVKEIAAMLPTEPRCVGPTIDDRVAWQALAAAPQFADVVRRAERLLDEPMPDLTDELYLDFSRTGNRNRCQRLAR